MLHYIKAGDEANNLDLFVVASTVPNAVKDWRMHYGLGYDACPERVWTFPETLQPLGPIPWENLAETDFRESE